MCACLHVFRVQIYNPAQVHRSSGLFLYWRRLEFNRVANLQYTYTIYLYLLYTLPTPTLSIHEHVFKQYS